MMMASSVALALPAAAPRAPDMPTMVAIPPGHFLMGSSDEERRAFGVPPELGRREAPRHAATIAYGFAIGRTEVTMAQYARFVRETGRPAAADGCVGYDAAHDAWTVQPGIGWDRPGLPTSPDHPVTCVSWVDASDYAAWLSHRTGRHYRLPSETEWEYAARAGSAGAAPWGDSAEGLCAHANVMNAATFAALGRPPSWRDRLMCSGTIPFTRPVASYPANGFGLFDMIGNVWEWTADCARDDYAGMPANGSAAGGADCRDRSIRGGAFHSAPYFGRAASRGFGKPAAYRSVAIGFRVLLDSRGETP